MPRKTREDQARTVGHPTRRVRYAVAVSLDGFIAGPRGECDWIISDPEIDFKAIYSQFDTVVMGRRTFDVVKGAGGDGSMPGMQVIVVSRTLRQEDHPGVRVVDDPVPLMAELRSGSGGVTRPMIAADVFRHGGGLHDGLIGRVVAEQGRVVIDPSDEGYGRERNRHYLDELLDSMGRGRRSAETFVRQLPNRLNNQSLSASLVRVPKDVWLFGGGSLFRSLAELGLVDTVEVAVIPVLLGEGVPLLPPPAKQVALKLTGHKLYAKTGIVSLEYAVQHGRESKRRQ